MGVGRLEGQEGEVQNGLTLADSSGSNCRLPPPTNQASDWQVCQQKTIAASRRHTATSVMGAACGALDAGSMHRLMTSPPATATKPRGESAAAFHPVKRQARGDARTLVEVETVTVPSTGTRGTNESKVCAHVHWRSTYSQPSQVTTSIRRNAPTRRHRTT